MAEITKHSTDSFYYIQHAYRSLPPGKTHGNCDIDSELTKQNYSLLNRCHTAKEANTYRKELEKNIFKYNRKNLIHTLEYVIQCPDDCVEEERFFQTAYQYVCDKVLPMGEKAVVTAIVHRDEHTYITNASGEKEDISKNHLHIIAVPAVSNPKDNGFDWKLSAHDLTTKKKLHQFHPGLQKACDESNLQATAYVPKKAGDGKVIPLTVKQLKEITNKTGIILEKALTIDELAKIINEHKEIKILEENLQEQLKEKVLQLEEIQKENLTLKQELEHVKEQTMEPNWGSSSWGESSSWGKPYEYTHEEEIKL